MTQFLKTHAILRYVTIAAVCLVPFAANAQVNQQRGATLGGLAGAVAGSLIGDKNGEAGAGAAIGGVVGAVTGGLLGNAADKEAALNQQQYFYDQQTQQQQQFAVTQSAVSIADVINMTRSGLSDSVIINQINQRGVQYTLQVPDIISLHQQGVREHVITAMQQAPTGVQRVARVPARAPVTQRVITPAPVIVEEHYLIPHYAPPRYPYRRPIHHHQHGFHIRF